MPAAEPTASASSCNSGGSAQVSNWLGAHAHPIPKCGIWGYTVLSLAASLTPSVLAMILLSKMGFGDSVWDFLIENSSHRYLVGFLALIIASILYMLDFYFPPHLPHKCFCLWGEDKFVGRGLLSIAGGMLLLASCLNPEVYPQVPLLISILLSPALVYLARKLVKPRHDVRHDGAGDIDHDDIVMKLQVLQNITGDEKDEHCFFRGALAGFWLTCVAMAIPWVVWNAANGGYKGVEGNTSAQEAIERFKWSTPIFCSVANFIWGCFVALRIKLETEYDSTNFYKEKLQQDSEAYSTLHEQLRNHFRRSTMQSLSSSSPSTSASVPVSDGDDAGVLRSVSSSTVMSSLRAANASSLNRLALCVKGVGIILITLLCGCYAAQMALSMNALLSELLLSVILTFLLVYFLFVWLTMGRMIHFLGAWLTDMPLYKMGKDVVESNWFFAGVVIVCYPAVPFIFAASWVNQKIRRRRGLYVDFADATRNHISSIHRARFQDMQELTLTPRVNVILSKIQVWDKKSVVTWTYIWCGAYIITKCSYTFASVLLAWCDQQLQGVNPALVIALTFVLGIALFLIPVTPGMLVYIFGGLVIAPTWPEDLGGWKIGCIVNILVSWVLKLLACAIQQKIIGEQLGNSLWIRQQCMLHKRFIRTLELILKKPGWSVGKVAVLCGGPDWPVSVGAGLLRLSLRQMLLGTLPIILFIIPCGMAGSAYVCNGECSSDLPAMMMMASVGVSVVQYFLIAWAAQATFEQNQEELTRKLAKHVDLEWLDYRSEEIAKQTDVPFDEVNPFVRSMFLLGSVLHMTIAHIYFWIASSIQGGFEIQDGIDTLVWYDDEWYSEDPQGLITNTLAIVWVLYGIGFVLWYQFVLWNSWTTAGPRKEHARRLDSEEAAWKDEFLQQAAQQAAQQEEMAANGKPQSGWKEADANMASASLSASAPLPEPEAHPACTGAMIPTVAQSEADAQKASASLSATAPAPGPEDHPAGMDVVAPNVAQSMADAQKASASLTASAPPPGPEDHPADMDVVPPCVTQLEDPPDERPKPKANQRALPTLQIAEGGPPGKRSVSEAPGESLRRFEEEDLMKEGRSHRDGEEPFCCAFS